MANTKEMFNEIRYGRKWTPPESEKPRIKSIIDLIESEGNEKKIVLDVGCNDGTISSLIFSKDKDVYGIDISKTAVELAKEKGIKALSLNIENESFPFPDEFFDIVLAGEIIEHVFDTDLFLRKTYNLLKKNGCLILTTPNLASAGRRMLLLFGKNPFIEVHCRNGSAGHIRYFTKENLFELLRSNGFSAEYFGSDVVNFDNSGRLFSTKLAKFFPNLGKTLIIKARKR